MTVLVFNVVLIIYCCVGSSAFTSQRCKCTHYDDVSAKQISQCLHVNYMLIRILGYFRPCPFVLCWIVGMGNTS